MSKAKSIVTDVREDHRLPLARWTSINRKLQNLLDREEKVAKSGIHNKKGKHEEEE